MTVQRPVVADTVRAIVSGEFGAIVVEDLSQDALATNGEGLLTVFTAMRAALPGILFLLGQGTVENRTRLLCALQATILALTFQTGIFTGGYLSSFQHCLTIVFAA